MSGWLEDYLLGDLKEKLKHKATEVREKRTRKTLKGKSTRLSLTALRMKFGRSMTHIFRSCSSVLIGLTRRSPRCPRMFGVCQPPVVGHLLRKVPLSCESHRPLQHLLKCVEV